MKNLPTNFKILYAIFGIICFVIITKLYVLSIARHEYYNKLSLENTIKVENLIQTRGQILDRNGEPLAINELGFTLSLKNRLKDSELDSELEFLKTYIEDIDTESMRNLYKSNNSIYKRTPVAIIDFIPYSQMQIIHSALLQRPNIFIESTTKRMYPNDESAAHVIGYIGASDSKDMEKEPISKLTKIIGKQGLEKQYNSFLQGTLRTKKIQVNSLNQQLKLLEQEKNITNNDIKISLDVRIQGVLDSVFEKLEGAGIVMDAHTGEILAAGSYPQYNINDFIGGISHVKYKTLLENPYKPLINKLINGQYPPGSVVKMGMALSFLEYADITESTIIQTPPYIEINNHKFRDWRAGGHGSADVYKAIRESVDVYFYKLSQIAGIDNMALVMGKMGFGEKTGVDLPFESSGIFPTPEWKLKAYAQQWYIGDTLQVSIGQGSFLATPMQIARYTALMATGELVTPHFIRELGDNRVNMPTQDVLTNFEKSKLPALRLGMYQVCSEPSGTAFHATQGVKVKLACKTGTAQVVGISQDTIKRMKESDMDYWKRSQSWMTVFLPYDNPKYVITILIEHGGGGGRGGPLIVKLANALYDAGYVR